MIGLNIILQILSPLRPEAKKSAAPKVGGYKI